MNNIQRSCKFSYRHFKFSSLGIFPILFVQDGILYLPHTVQFVRAAISRGKEKDDTGSTGRSSPIENNLPM